MTTQGESPDFSGPPLDWVSISRRAERALGHRLTDPRIVHREPMTGGQVSPLVELMDVAVHESDGSESIIQLVLKRTTSSEVTALRALAALPVPLSVIPALLDSGTDAHGPWILTMCHPGSSPDGNDAVPDDVLAGLGTLHTHFAKPEEAWLLHELDPVTDESWFELCMGWTRSCIATAGEERPHPVLMRADAVVTSLAEDPRMHAALQTLPQTLVHGDVHAGNVLSTGESSVLIDWGNARCGPALLDVVNCAPPGSRGFDRYLAAVRQAGGSPDLLSTVPIGAAWATVHTNVQYLGWAAGHLDPGQVGVMLDRSEAALADLGRVLW